MTDERIAFLLLNSGKFEITEDDSVNLLKAYKQKRIEVVKVLIEHPAINLNIKDEYERSAFSLCYPNAKLAKVMLETGKINLDQDKAVVNLVHKENGTIEFELRKWQIIMNSRDSVESIKNPDTLFPSDVNEWDISLAEIEEGDKFLSGCMRGDTKHVKKCLESSNTSVLNRIDADLGDGTGLHFACSRSQLDVVKLLVNHQQINVNVKNIFGESALHCCIDNKEVATVLLESGKMNFQGMKGVKNFAESENGSFQFEFYSFPRNYLIKMDSPTSLNSIASRD